MSKSKAQALRLARQARKKVKEYARGGDVDINDTFDPTEGGQIPRSIQLPIRQLPNSWKPKGFSDPPATDRYRSDLYAEGGGVEDEAWIHDPSFKERWYDRASGAGANYRPTPGMDKALFRTGRASENRPPDRDFAEYGAFGELKGTAPEDTPVEYKTKNPLTDITVGDLDRGLDVGMGAGPGIMVGPYGAFMLGQAGKLKPHPVYAKEVADRASTIQHPEVRDAYVNAEVLARDLQARRDLERLPEGASDSQIWNRSGWYRGSEGVPRKEIPDIGARLEPIFPGSDKYALNHPAGDLHKIYDIPPIKFDPSMKPGNGSFDIRTNQITIGGYPTQANLDKGVTVALHEIQHMIQKKEGMNKGANPYMAMERPEMTQEYFPKTGLAEHDIRKPDLGDTVLGPRPDTEYLGEKASIPSWQQERAATQRFPESKLGGYQRGLYNVYQRSAGETESRNVQNRRAKGFNYRLHPEDTADVPAGLQWQDKEFVARPREEVLEHIRKSYERKQPKDWAKILKEALDNPVEKKAGGGQVGNFNPERASAYGLARQGMIKSTVPGRTDKINMKVPTGSYIIPADIPSAIGEGNSEAGNAILNKMFNKGPYGMNLPKRKAGMRVGSRKSSLFKMGFAEGGVADYPRMKQDAGTMATRGRDVLRDMMTRPRLSQRMRADMGDAESIAFGFPNQRAEGGATDEAPIIAAGGEYVLHPETVMQLGDGDIDLGHSILDDFVKEVRSKNIRTLEGLKPPKGSK